VSVARKKRHEGSGPLRGLRFHRAFSQQVCNLRTKAIRGPSLDYSQVPSSSLQTICVASDNVDSSLRAE